MLNNPHNVQIPSHHNQTNAITLSAESKPHIQRQPCVYTLLGDLFDAIFEKLAKDNLVRYPQKQPLEPNQSRASWYKDNEFYKFYYVKGHTTLKCMQLKDYVQDLIDQKEIIAGAHASPNVGLMIYQNTFPPHNTNLGKAPTNPPVNKPNNAPNKQGENRDKSQNYASAYLDYGSLIGYISQVEPSINVINIKGLETQCLVTTH